MQTMKRIICLMLAAVMTLALSGVVVSADTVTDNDQLLSTGSAMEIRNVKFYQAGEEVFTLDNTAGEITADVVVNTLEEDAPLTLIMAAYDGDGKLQTASVVNTAAIIGLPTVSSEAIAVDAETAEVKLLVWNNLTAMVPLTTNASIYEAFVLNGQSRDTRITDFKVTIAGDTYSGLINHDLKNIQVYVPTSFTDNWSSADDTEVTPLTDDTYVKVKETALTESNMPANYNGMTPGEYYNGVQSLVPQITAVGTIADVDTEKNFLNLQEYTVTAPNGETATYSVSVSSFAVQYASNFTKTRLGTTYAANTISTLEDTTNPGTYFSTNTWTSNSNTKVSNHRTGMFSAGGIGSGSWRFMGEKSYVLQTHAADTDDMKIGFETTSPLKVDFATSDGTDGKSSGDRYGVVTYGYGADTTNSGGTAGFQYTAPGIEAAKEIMVSYDFNLKNNTGTGFVRMQTPYFQAILAGTLQTRGSSRDNSFKGNSPRLGSETLSDGSTGGYSTIRSVRTNDTLEITKDAWHNLTYIHRPMPMAYADDGKMAVITEFYLDNIYAGYTYAVDFGALYTEETTDAWYGYLKAYRGDASNPLVKFSHSNKTYVDFCMDNMLYGTPYTIKPSSVTEG